MVPTGLYPRNAAKSAPVAGIWLNCDEREGGRPAVESAEATASGRLAVSEEIIIVKKTATLTVCPMFWRVAWIPEATPLCSGGAEFMIVVMFGDEKSPPPSPMMKSITANGR